MLEMPESQQRRIYRWGSHYGILSDKWICETRKIASECDEYIVYTCQPDLCDLLPMEMDDIWDEEYVSVGKHIEYNGLLSIRGDTSAILETAKLQQLPIPPLPTHTIHDIPKTSLKMPVKNNPIYTKAPRKVHSGSDRKCLIRD